MIFSRSLSLFTLRPDFLMFGVFSAPPGPPVEGNEGKWGGARRDTGGTPEGHRTDTPEGHFRSRRVPHHVPPVSRHVPPCPARVPPMSRPVPPKSRHVRPSPAMSRPMSRHVPPMSRHVPPKSRHVPPMSRHVPPCPAQVPPCPAHVPPCPAQVPPKSRHVPPRDMSRPSPAQVPPCPAQAPPCPAQVPPCPAQVSPCPAQAPLRFARLALEGYMIFVIFQCQSCAVGTCIQQLPRNPTRLEVQLRFLMHSTFVCSSTFLLLADGMPAKRGRGASPETSRVVQRVDREEETRTAASDRGEASRAERSRTPPPVAARATWRWCWILTIQDGGEEVWWWRWWRQ